MRANKCAANNQRKVASIQEKVEKMSYKFRELKNCQFPVVKIMIIQELRKLASEIEEDMQQYQQPSNTKRRRQIQDVLKKCQDIEEEMKEQTNQDIGGGGRHKLMHKNLQEIDDPELSKKALHSVIYHQIRTSELKISPKEYDQIYNRMVKNQQVMKDIEMMVKQQGHNLDKVDEYLQSVYENVSNANEELKQAQELQKQSRRLKFRLAISGFFAALGYKILGIPGMIAGLFTGHRVTS